MSRLQHKDELFIAEYTLGLLEPAQLAQAHALLGSDETAVACALEWEQRLLDLTDSLTPLHSSEQLLNRIQNTLGLPQTRSVPKPRPAPPVQRSAAPRPPASASHAAARPSEPPLQSAADTHFEPRLIKPDASSTPVAPPSGDRPSHTAQTSSANTVPQRNEDKSSSISTGDAGPKRVRIAPPDPMEGMRASRETPSHTRPSIWHNLWFWRVFSGALAILAAVLILTGGSFGRQSTQSASLQPVVTPPPQIVQVAIMQAPGTSSTPGWVLTVDSRQNIVLTPQVDIQIPDSESMYLWTYTEQSPHPRLLGLIDPLRSLTLSAEATEVVPGQIFEMTQEPNLALPSEPAGPILFIGRTVSLG